MKNLTLGHVIETMRGIPTVGYHRQRNSNISDRVDARAEYSAVDDCTFSTNTPEFTYIIKKNLRWWGNRQEGYNSRVTLTVEVLKESELVQSFIVEDRPDPRKDDSKEYKKVKQFYEKLQRGFQFSTQKPSKEGCKYYEKCGFISMRPQEALSYDWRRSVCHKDSVASESCPHYLTLEDRTLLLQKEGAVN